jgi:molybdate transport repressor ModE-like protein
MSVINSSKLGDPSGPRNPPYKDLSLQQMRSFLATARRGSFAGAARDLNVAQPTVWKLIRSLEASFGVRLVERQPRGCRLTGEGRLLEDLLTPLVSEFDAVRDRYDEALARKARQFRVAGTPRIIEEDLPRVIAGFERRFRRVQLVLRTATDEGVAGLVDSGECELGLCERTEPAFSNPRFSFERAYELDILLVTPRRHLLARKRTVSPEDLRGHPMVTAPGTVRDPNVRARFARHRVFETPARVGVFTTAGIRRYVALRLGIGLIPAVPSPELRRILAAQGLVARPMTRFFGRAVIYSLRRADVTPNEIIRGFLESVKRAMEGV